ncbi:discoidin domain-containing protein [Paenibacillus sp. CFBP 13594]|uniref:discoidin domain-containing protein n=1 Tax=Paenibacillus sp. CFBP 13594 TaxID=2774037 RepID=UPI00177DE93C|nr:discoidin domain-containing protein [Paenibacillus sp. CFBP 13594]MBD8839517.1 discoidin domain-containing protein [Paenibacillus sp. CFBP 13594]
MAIYLKLSITGVISGTSTFEAIQLIQVYDSKNNLISLNNTNVIEHNYINRKTASDIDKWFVPSDGGIPYDTPNNEGIIVIKLPEAVLSINKISLKSYVNTGGGKNVSVFYSRDSISYKSLGLIVFSTINETKEVDATSTKLNKFLISSEDKYQSLPYGGTDLIPKMTSDILPSGIATCSSTFSTTGAYNAFNAFDKNIVQSGSFNSWVTASGQLAGWLAYEFPAAIVVNKYTLVHGYNNVNVAPKSWTFEGINDSGLTWTVLDQRSNVTDWTLWTEKEFEFANIKKFKKYRINITANNGSTSYVGIQELKMYDTNRTLLFCPSTSEGIYIKYGLNKNEVIETYKQMSKKSYLTTSSTQIGSGKVFKQKIDTTKTPIKKASIT